MKKVYIVAAKRTAIGSFLGTLSGVHPAEYGANTLKAMLEEVKVDPKNLDEVIVGNILPAGLGQGIARQVALKAGVPVEVPAYSLNMVCGSGMKSIANAFANIKLGLHNLVVAGGVESMSNAPYLIPAQSRGGFKMGDRTITDHMIGDALTDVFNNYHMGVTAENIAAKYELSREEQDEFAWTSQQRAIKAVDSGVFKKEIVPYVIKTRRGETVFDTDEFPNRTTSLEKLGGLRPAFIKDGTVTAGNSSGINDGASFVLVASEDAVKKYNLTPLAEIVAVGQGGVDPSIMGMGPVPAIRQALKNADLKLTDIDVFELNEAFAAQSLGVLRELTNEHGVSKEYMLERTNLNGGAIALGHPVGASGNRIVVTLIHEMLRNNKKLGLASLCIGGGMGTAVILKKV
ncbi:MAG: acetyl-CoA C-acetyltransferase [Acholeplasmataceae bacterium]|jgi:acetyl-CoA C-acetyltransferase